MGPHWRSRDDAKRREISKRMTDTSALVLATQNWSTGDKLFYVVGCLLLAEQKRTNQFAGNTHW